MIYLETAVKNRRRGPDLGVKLVRAASVAAWVLLLAILALIDRAKPQMEDFFSRLFKVSLRQGWDANLLESAYYLSIAAFLFYSFTFFVNLRRHRRKTDRYSKSVIMMILLSALVIAWYWLKLQ